ncbi:hypothetical protein L195_g054993, partial [Trifolium pratense]
EGKHGEYNNENRGDEYNNGSGGKDNYGEKTMMKATMETATTMIEIICFDDAHILWCLRQLLWLVEVAARSTKLAVAYSAFGAVK